MTASKSSSGVAQTREELLATPAPGPRSSSRLLPKFGATGARSTSNSGDDNPAVKIVAEIQRLDAEDPHRADRADGDVATFHPSDFGRGRKYAMATLKRHPWNARRFRSPERIRRLALQLAAEGQTAPALLAQDPAEPGTYFIVDGDTRFLSAKSLHWQYLWGLEVEVDLSDPFAVYTKSFKATDSTIPISPVDQAIRWNELIEGKYASLDDIANELGRTKSNVSSMMAYTRLPEDVLEYISENIESFPFSVAAELVRVAKDQNTDSILALCKHIVAENVSRRGLEDAAKRVFGQDSVRRSYNKRKQTHISLEIKQGDNAIGQFRTFDTGAIEFKIVPEAEMPEGVRDHIAEVLKIVAEAASKGDVTEVKQLLQAKLREIE